MYEYWEAGPIAGAHTVHLAKNGDHAECKPYTQEDLATVIIQVHLPARAPGFGNALANRLCQARVAPEALCVECFTPEFRTIYADLIRRTVQAVA